MSRTIMETVMLTATPEHVGQNDWSRLQAGGTLQVVGCWHPEHGAFRISVFATSKANAVAVATRGLKGTGAVACYADVSDPAEPFSRPCSFSGVSMVGPVGQSWVAKTLN
jgi:hypothetical protein